MTTLDWPETGAHLPNLTEFKSEAWLDRSGRVGGIYLLYKDDVVVYIGQSANVASRLKTHRKEALKEFHTARVYPLDDLQSRVILEGILILYFRPPYNRGLNLGLSCGRVWEVKWKRPRG